MRQLLSVMIFLFTINSSAAEAIQFQKHGPNCFNAALVEANVLSTYRYISKAEMLEILNSKACHRIHPKAVLPGDLRIYYFTQGDLAPADRLIHANIFISDTLSLNKMTDFLTTKIQLEKESEVKKNYDYTSEIIWHTERSGLRFQCRGERCKNTVRFVRCSSIEQLLASEKSLGDLYNKFKSISNDLQKFVLTHHNESALIKSLEESITFKLSDFKNALQSLCENTQDGFSCRYYLEASKSFQWQLQRPQPSQSWLENYFGDL